jgi:poly(3-hydroxybutyrate) depolymerase
VVSSSIVIAIKTLAKVSMLLLLLASAACSSKSKHTARALAPLAAAGWSVQLPVKGFGPATVAVPLGATAPRPIVVVLHGALDRAEWQCGSFRGVLGGRAFILCPQGVLATGDGKLYGLGTFDESGAELRAALAALKARFGRYVAPSPIVLIGYGEGAAVAVDLARQEPSFFARVALVNGDAAAFNPSTAHTFAERGGKRVLFVCLTDACQNDGVERALLLQRGGVAAKSVRAEAGPYFDERLVGSLRAHAPWLLEGDKRFPAFPVVKK